MAPKLVVAGILTAGVACSAFGTSGSLIAVQQDAGNAAIIESIRPSTGEVSIKSPVSFVFDWPLIQMTTNAAKKEVYIVSYPETAPGPVLFLLDEKLKQVHAWDATPYSFFDLQYSATQSTLYGIYVSSTYGRVLSKFTADPKSTEVTHHEVFTLPYMWYVNASSFHTETSHYYALINNFPGKENSTLDQQLIVADFSVDVTTTTPEVNVYPITNPSSIVQFIAFSANLNTLFYGGMKFNSTVMEIGVLDTASGKVEKIVWTHPAVDCGAGPLIADEVDNRLLVFLKSTTVADSWELWALPYHFVANGDVLSGVSREVSVVPPYKVRSYTGKEYQFFAAGVVTGV